MHRLSDSDVEDILSLLEQLGPERKRTGLSDSFLDALFDQKNVGVVLARDPKRHNKIIGMATVSIVKYFSGRKAHIEDVVVDKGHRRKGIGVKILKEALQKAKAMGAEYVYLTSRPSRTAANKLYKGAGFEKINTNSYRLKL